MKGLPATAVLRAFALGALLAACGCGRRRPPPAPPPPAAARVPAAPADPVVLSAAVRELPGRVPTRWLQYRDPSAAQVLIAGSWDRWSGRTAMRRDQRDGVWRCDLGALGLPFGRHEFKFLPDGRWEPGPNRALFVNEAGWLERPLGWVLAARQESATRIDVALQRAAAAARQPPRVRLIPPAEIAGVTWLPGRGAGAVEGYIAGAGAATFLLDEAVYGLALTPGRDRVAVAGTFNGWNGDGGDGGWRLEDEDNDGVWERTLALSALLGPGAADVQFKFVVNGSRWLEPPPRAPNLTGDGHGNRNLRFDPSFAPAPLAQVHTREPLPLDQSWTVVLEHLAPRPVYGFVTPGGVLDQLRTDAPFGLERAGSNGLALCLFAPRARKVDLCLFDTPHHAANGTNLTPRETIALAPCRIDGTWRAQGLTLAPGQYYALRLAGPEGPGEGFNPQAFFGDPYARAVAHSMNNAIWVDPLATNRWFGGWTDQDYRPPAWSDVVIYEAHVRDLTRHPSAGVAPELRGAFEGLLASEPAGTALEHLRRLGVNMIELLPVAEFENGTNDYSWGYGPVYPFAPEASFGRAPLQGSAYYEFKRLVNELHRRGFGVILDVVYNHVGAPNVLALIDRKYYFRLAPDFSDSNFSGCGNDLRSEAPMLRRLIVDNVLYWMREHHVDGFRFDLAELIDLETLMAVRDAARAVNPRVLLISEPWSRRGDHKRALRGAGWAAWNNEFRDAVHRFALGHGDPAHLRQVMAGSVDLWAATPLQAINYLESHDDLTLADVLSSQPGRDGRRLTETDAARNRLAATVLFTSLGLPMLAEGQEFLRSKHGRHNTYNQGDHINALNWTDRERPLAAETLAYYRGLIALRRSPAGAAFRLDEPAPAGYFRWIETDERRALGCLVNADRQRPGAAFAVLLNAADRPVDFALDLPAGRWRWVGDGRRVAPAGLPGPAAVEPGARRLTVPALTAYLLAAE